MQLFTEIIPPAYFLAGFCLTVAVLVLLSCVQNAIHNLPYYRIPAVGMSRWSLFDRQANVCFMASARALIREGFEQVVPSWTYLSFGLIRWDTARIGPHDVPSNVSPRPYVSASSKVCG